MLIVFAAALAISALTAESPSTPLYKRGECKNWPSDAEKPKFEAAFNKALQDSATNETLRKNLLKSPRSAQTAVEKILDELYPNEKIKFPKRTVVTFYEPEEPAPDTPLELNLQTIPNYPNEHCLHIFYLPEKGKPVAPTTDFKHNLMCCYKPW